MNKEYDEKEKSRIKKKKMKISLWQYFALLLVLAVLYSFAARKEGYHMDELLSFELSNGLFNPWIVPTQPVGRLAKFVQEEIKGDSLKETWSNLVETGMDVLRNKGNSKILQYKADVYPEPVWISGEQFRDYVTTGSGDRFQYLSVYFNVKDDNHPPLHFMLLHTVSSLFPGKLEPMMGCLINLFAILGCMLCIVRLAMLLENHGMIPAGYGRTGGVCASLLYGLSVGGIATVLLIRMYGLMTFFCVALFYLHVKKWLEKDFGKQNKLLAAVTALGFLTQYFFLFYCLTLAAVTAVLLAAKKRFRELKRYILSMVCAAVIGVGVFPFAVADVFSSGRGVEALQNLGSGLAGYGVRLRAFWEIGAKAGFGSVGMCAGVLAALAAALCVGGYIRKKAPAMEQEPAAKQQASMKQEISAKQQASMKQETGAGQQASMEQENVLEKGMLKGEALSLLLMLLLPVFCYFLLAAKAAPYLVDRYLMPLFPFGAMILALLLGAVFVLFFGKAERKHVSFTIGHTALFMVYRRKVGWMLVPALLLGVVNVSTYDGTYLYRGYENQLQVAVQYRELPCICLYDGVGYYENLPEFAQYDRTLLVKPAELEERQDASDLAGLDVLVVLRKSAVDEAGAFAVLEKYGWEVESVLVPEEESVHGDTVYLCRRFRAQ